MDISKEDDGFGASGPAAAFNKRARESLLSVEDQDFDPTFRPSTMWQLNSHSCLIQYALFDFNLIDCFSCAVFWSILPS